MKTKNYLLKTLALVLAMIILLSNFSFVFASSLTTEDIQKSLRDIFNTKVIIKDSNGGKTTYPAIGDAVSIDDTSIKFVDAENKKEYSYATYTIEDNKLIFTTDFSDFYTSMIEEYQKNDMEITDEIKNTIAMILQIDYISNTDLEFLAASNALNKESHSTYTYFQQNVVEKMYDTSETEDYTVKNIDVKSDLASIKINVENNTLTTAVFTLDLDKLEALTGENIDLNKNLYEVYFNELPDDKKENISEFKSWFEVNSKYTYTGKAIKPVVYGGFFLEEGTDYKVTYSNNKKIGKATIKVTGIGDYKGSFTKTFKIVPKGTTISKVAKKTTNSFKLKWNKQTTQTKGYQIQYSTNKNFTSGNKKVTITNNKTTSKKITGLKENKNYYVRIRTYKTVNGTKYLKDTYGKNVIKKVTFDSVKVYNKSEIKKDESLKGYKIGSNDIVFDKSYNLKVKASNSKKMELTAATGEIKGNWIKNKSNCGILKYKSNSYKVTAFGTGF